MTDIVYKVSAPPELTKTEIMKPKPPSADGEMQFSVQATAECIGNQQKRAVVKPNAPAWSAFSILCDEGTALGGSDAAPSPLCYLVSGIAFCLLTHLESFTKASDLKADSLRVEIVQTFATNIAAIRGKIGDVAMWGKSTGIEVHVLIDSDETDSLVGELHKQTINACMALQAIVQAVPLAAHVHLNGKELEVLTDSSKAN
jgi:uncharacterized OsmC-like protein